MNEFQVIKPLGHGNYGQVSLVLHKDSNRTFVCKCIPLQDRSPQHRKNAENEVRVMATLAHPNIVAFMKGFIEKENLYIVMEYADGSDLEKLLIERIKMKQALPEDTILSIFVQIALAIRKLHKSHLLHRDLKSANVFLTANHQVKIGDFGFAKQLSCTGALATTVCGTPYYFSPELCQKKPYSSKTDVWSLGVILYEMINLHKPFEAQNLTELRKRVVNEEPAPFLATHVSAELKQLCLMLLTKSQELRPSIDAVLRVPIVRRYLEKLCNDVEERRRAAAEKDAAIRHQYPRETQQVPQVPTATVGGSGKVGVLPGTFSKAALMQFHKTGVAPADVVIAKAEPQQEATQTLHNRPIPDVVAQLSSATPPTVVGALANLVEEQYQCDLLKADVQSVLTVPSSMSDSDVNAAIGEPQSEEESRLRDLLGETAFVRGIELILMLSEQKDAARHEALYAELLTTLGDKAYVIEDLQRVSFQFGLDE